MAVTSEVFSEDKLFIEVVWKIEKFSVLWHEPGFYYDTGDLGLQIEHYDYHKYVAAPWSLRLYPRGDSGGSKCLYVGLHRGISEGACSTVNLMFEFSLLDVNNQPIFVFCNGKDFKTEYVYSCWLESCEKVLSNTDLYLPNDILTVRCRISYDYIFRSQNAFVFTKFHFHQMSVIWQLLSLESGAQHSCKATVPIVENLCTQPANLTLSYKNVETCEWIEFCLENLLDSYNMHIQCRITLKESNKLYVLTGKNIEKLSSLKWHTKSLLSLEQLLAAKESSPNSDLEAKCDFLVLNKVPYVEKICGEPFVKILTCDRKFKSDLTSAKEAKDFLKSDLMEMYKNGLHCDLSVQVQSDSYPVHSAILAARSPVISSMLESDMKEKTSRTIVVKDLDSETCSKMLDYFYTDNPGELDVPMCCKLYYAGDKYQVPGLKILCSNSLKCKIDQDNVFDILLLADRHSDENLKIFAIDYICKYKNNWSEEKWCAFMEQNSRLGASIIFKMFQSK